MPNPAYFLAGSGRGGGVVLAAASFADVFVAFGFFASRLDFCWPFATSRLLLSNPNVRQQPEDCKGIALTSGVPHTQL